jgi:dolichol-phosphate mannosyltransferase
MNLDETYRTVKETVFQCCPSYAFEWVLVDDGSGDDTLAKALAIQRQDSRVKVVKLSRNFGEFRAIVAGMSQADGDAIAVISADLQDPPELIPEMIQSWEARNPVTLAVRKDREESALKNWFADTYYKLVRRWVVKDYPKRGFDFFLIDALVARELVFMQEKNSSIYLQLIWLGYQPKTIEYTRREREKGKSMWTYAKRIDLFIDTFIVFSHHPIRFISGCGLLVSLIGFVFAVYFIIDKLGHQVMPGWTSLMVAVLLLSGFQMVMLGIIGEYLWRTLDETRKRPLYVIEKVFEYDEDTRK